MMMQLDKKDRKIERYGECQILPIRNNLTNSNVVNIFINDCCLRCVSLDQIVEFVDNANAKYGESFGSGKFLIASIKNDSYSDFSKKVIKLLSSVCLISNSCSEIFDFSRQSSLYLFNSSFMNSGVINSEAIESSKYVEIELGLKSENKMLLSNTSFILVYFDSSLLSGDIEFNNSSLFLGDSSESNFLNESFFAFLPKSTDHLINSCSSLEFNFDRSNSVCLMRSISLSLINLDQLTQQNRAISDFNSGFNANVIDAIYISPLFFSSSSAESSLVLLIMICRTTSAIFTSGNCFLNLASSSSGTDTVIFGILVKSCNYFNTNNYVYKCFGLILNNEIDNCDLLNTERYLYLGFVNKQEVKNEFN